MPDTLSEPGHIIRHLAWRIHFVSDLGNGMHWFFVS